MRYREIPNTNLRVSTICLGTGPIGTGVNEENAFRILDQFVESGGNFLDTARAYAIWVPGGEGISERIIGRWLDTRGYRDSVVVATKGAHPALTTMNVPRLARDEITLDCERSLEALGLDTIPLYWLHRDDPSRPIEDIMDTMESLRQAGKIRYYGCSNWSAERMREALQFSSQRGLTGFVANQPMWSYAEVNPGGILDPTSYHMDENIRQFHAETSFPVIPYTSQARGLFTKWAMEGLDSLDPSLLRVYDNPINRSRFHKVQHLSEQTGHSITALAVAWLSSQPDFVTIPIVWGSESQLADVLSAGDLVLDRELIESLT